VVNRDRQPTLRVVALSEPTAAVHCARIDLQWPRLDWDGDTTMLFDGGFTFGNFITDAFTIFMFILWFWLLIVVSGDLFRRHDVSGFAKVLWVIAFVLFSYLGVFAYLLTQGRGMAERNRAQATEAREELRHIVGFSAADEIVKLDKLKMAGSITEQEYGRLRAKLVQ
jgi:cbb3-type cytochrome oxidase subunit 3